LNVVYAGGREVPHVGKNAKGRKANRYLPHESCDAQVLAGKVSKNGAIHEILERSPSLPVSRYIDVLERVVVDVGVPVELLGIVDVRCLGVRLNEAAELGVVVATAVIVESGVGVEDLIGGICLAGSSARSVRARPLSG
jgi:hypothetical protein